MAAIQTIGVVAKPKAAPAAEAGRALMAHLAQRGLGMVVESAMFDELAIPGSKPVTSDEMAAQADVIVVLGGDGTLIHAAEIARRKETDLPILGVNLGSLGFMTEVPLAEMLPMLDAVLAGQHRVEKRLKLSVELIRAGVKVFSGEVLNDAVINKGAVARIADLEATVDGRRVTTYKADGVIVATPTGSTAYSISAGGPILVPTLEAVIITPICPHALTQRPLVVPDQSLIELQLTSDNGEVYLTLDGQVGFAMQQGDTLRVRRSARPMLLIKNPNIDYFGLLRAKLRWGER